MSKPIILHLLLFSLACQLTSKIHIFVKADEQLTQEECHNANIPEVCIQCLRSDPQSENAYKVGIAEIIVGCLTKHVNNLQANMTSLASSAKNGQFKMMLEQYEDALSSTHSLLTQTVVELKNGQYDEAELSVSEALWYEVSCDRIFGRHEAHLPTDVVYEMKIYKELSEAANRIVERL